ncbi:MAG: hypothetical protein AAF702_28190 [Chloroflexota bacterium]
MKFSAMFWNVENFGRYIDDPDKHAQRVARVRDHIRSLDPDLFCLSEIKDKVSLRNLLLEEFVDYDFGITDGNEQIELLSGWRRGKFEQVLFTQRREFKADSTNLRPGSLVSARFGGEFYNFLFLHTDSGRNNRDYRNRQDMFEKIWSLKHTLDDITGGQEPAFFMVKGDLNTMGRSKSGQFLAVSGEQEIADLGEDAQSNGMLLLPKTHDITWRKGPSDPNFESNLDHSLATINLEFKLLSNATGQQDAPVSVDGWNNLGGDERDEFSEFVSDHCSVYCEIL